MLVFNKDTGFTVSEIEDVRTEIANQWKLAFKEDNVPELNTDAETPAGQLVDSQTASIAQKDAEIAFLASQFNPLTASGVFQDALAKIYFINRLQAVNSSATLTCVGRQGTVIASGSQIRSEVDNTIWTIDDDVTIDATGQATATATCTSSGAIEASPNTLTQIITITTGWDTVTNPQSATVGRLAETQSAFEARRYESVALNSRGTLQSVYARIAQLDGVLSVVTVQNRTNQDKYIDSYKLTGHSMLAVVIGGEDEEIAKAIYNSVSAGCDYNGNTAIVVTDESTGVKETVKFLRPDALEVYVKVTVQGTDLHADYEELVKDAVFDNFYGTDDVVINGLTYLRVKPYEDVFASRFLPSILEKGVNGVLGVELSLDNATWSNKVHIPIDKNPTLEKINVSVIVRD